MKFHRVRGARGAVSFVEAPAPSPAAAPVRLARLLAVAHAFSAMLGRADGPSRAELAAALRMTTARLSQILDLTLLAPDIQEEIAFLNTPDGAPVPERAVRYVVRAAAWDEQRRRWRALARHGGGGTRDRPWAGERAGAPGRPRRAPGVYRRRALHAPRSP